MSKLIKIITAVAIFGSTMFVAFLANAQDAIKRNDEGRMFYSTIEVPANADQLFVSGKGPRPVNPDAPRAERSYGTTEQQARSTFTVSGLAVDGWLIEIDVRGARIPVNN